MNDVDRLESWRFVLPALLLGCQAPDPSPSEALPGDAAIVPSARPCLAETHPVLMQWLTPFRSALMATDRDGRNSMRLGEGAFVYGPVWAPDGRSIALRRMVSSNYAEVAASELVLLAPGEDEEVVLTADSVPVLDGLTKRYADGPSWSSDGRELAFASLQDSSYWRIWMISRSGGERRLLLPDVHTAHYYPSWSPTDANHLAYVSEGQDGARDLWVVELGAGSAPRNLTRGGLGSIEAPRWSPDGERIAISAIEGSPDAAADGAREIFIIEVATSKLTRLTRDASIDLQPVWSPDGASLLVTTTRPTADAGAQGAQHVWEVPVLGGELKLLTEAGSATVASDWYGSATMSSDWYAFATCEAR